MGLLSTCFDKYACTKRDITVGYTDDSGNWIPAVYVDSSFSANVSDVSLKDLEFIDPALVETGVRKLSCESTIAILPEDEITVTEKDGSSSSWVVVEKISATDFLKKFISESRETFLLRRLI